MVLEHCLFLKREKVNTKALQYFSFRKTINNPTIMNCSIFPSDKQLIILQSWTIFCSCWQSFWICSKPIILCRLKTAEDNLNHITFKTNWIIYCFANTKKRTTVIFNVYYNGYKRAIDSRYYVQLQCLEVSLPQFTSFISSKGPKWSR